MAAIATVSAVGWVLFVLLVCACGIGASMRDQTRTQADKDAEQLEYLREYEARRHRSSPMGKRRRRPPR